MVDAPETTRGEGGFVGGLLLAAAGVWVSVVVLATFSAGDALDLALGLAGAVAGVVMIVRSRPLHDHRSIQRGLIPDDEWRSGRTPKVVGSAGRPNR
jgi:hypothetical protein